MRCIYASSLSLFARCANDWAINEQWRPRPATAPPVLANHLGEFVCREFSREGRIAITWRDAAQAIRLGLTVDLATLPSRCEVFNILADLPHQRYSCEKNKRLLGFTPQDRLEAMWRRK